MCYQIVEEYSACHCPYYAHAIDRCRRFGRPGHSVTKRTIYVGYACQNHQSQAQSRRGARAGASRETKHSPTISVLSRDSIIKLFSELEDTNEEVQKSSTKNAIPPSGAPAGATQPSTATGATQTSSAPSNNKSLVETESGFQPTLPPTGTNHFQDSDDQESDSDCDSLAASETNSIISVASTAITVDDDITCALFSRLLHFGNFQYLWPQLVAQSGTRTRCIQTTERFLRRWADDLGGLVAKQGLSGQDALVCQTAYRIVRRSRLDISQRIWEALGHRDDGIDNETQDKDASQLAQPLDLASILHVDEADDDFKDVAYDIAERFLFETEPIKYLELNIKSLLKAPIEAETVNSQNVAETWFVNSSPEALGPQTPGTRLLDWKCSCGFRGRDRYTELRPGGLQRLEERLNEYFKTAANDPQPEKSSSVTAPRALGVTAAFTRAIFFKSKAQRLPHHGGSPEKPASTELRPGDLQRLEERLNEYLKAAANDPQPENSSSVTAPRALGVTAAFTRAIFFKSKAQSLPHHGGSPEKPASTLGVCQGPPDNNSASRHKFALLCVPDGSSTHALQQAEACRIISDQEFFRLLQHQYQEARSSRSWARMRRVSGIQFVKFQLYSALVDIREAPAIPRLPADVQQYDFEAVTDTCPPIGATLLAHLLEHPQHADVLPTLYNMIPKKLYSRLDTSVKGKVSTAWGLQYIEGPNWFKVFLLGCWGFALTMVFAITWSIVRNDIQGAFAISGFMLGFMGFCFQMARIHMQLD